MSDRGGEAHGVMVSEAQGPNEELPSEDVSAKPYWIPS